MKKRLIVIFCLLFVVVAIMAVSLLDVYMSAQGLTVKTVVAFCPINGKVKVLFVSQIRKDLSASRDFWYVDGGGNSILTAGVMTEKNFNAIVHNNRLKQICFNPIPIVYAASKTVELTINSTTAIVNGVSVTLDVPAFIKESRTFLPLRFISEAFGYKTEWIAETQEVIISSPSGDVITLKIGSNDGTINGASIIFDRQPFIKEGRTVVPIRLIIECFAQKGVRIEDFQKKDSKGNPLGVEKVIITLP